MMADEPIMTIVFLAVTIIVWVNHNDIVNLNRKIEELERRGVSK